MKTVLPFILSFTLTSCTYSITLVHSQGADSDVTENQSTSPNVSASVPVNMKPM